jgi:hypothetical protein
VRFSRVVAPEFVDGLAGGHPFQPPLALRLREAAQGWPLPHRGGECNLRNILR